MLPNERNGTNPWVLIDLSYLAYRAKHGMGHLSHEDQATGVIYGFFEQLRSICWDPNISSNKVAIFFDSRQSYRRNKFPWYKSNRRERTSEEKAELDIMYQQINLLRAEILPTIGFLTYKQIGLESDDLIAQAAKQLSTSLGPTKREGVIITSDKDLYQCITYEVHWYDPARRLYLDREGFTTKIGKLVSPHQWGMVKQIAGCPGDCVPGIRGVGEPSACDYMMGLLSPRHKRYKDIESPEGQAIIERNKELVVLPHPKTGVIALTPPEYDPVAFFDFCERFGIESYLTKPRRREWELFFEGKVNRGQQTSRKKGQPRGKR